VRSGAQAGELRRGTYIAENPLDANENNSHIRPPRYGREKLQGCSRSVSKLWRAPDGLVILPQRRRDLITGFYRMCSDEAREKPPEPLLVAPRWFIFRLAWKLE
jgi:hypothetical protein